MPKIEFALLCDYAMAPNNQLSAISVIDHMEIRKFPYSAHFYLAGVVHLDPGLIYHSDVRVLKPGKGTLEERTIKTESGTFDMTAVPRSKGVVKVSLAIPLEQVPFPAPGTYTVEIVFDNLCLHSIPLLIEQLR